MKTKTQVLKENPDYKTLINAVINRIGMDSVQDVINHGIGGGFSGFIYYKDTLAFWSRYKKDILKLAKEEAESFGQPLMEMIGSFGCLKYYDARKEKWEDLEGQEAIGQTIYGGKTDGQVGNAMAWFAAEEVCGMFEN